MEKEVSCTNSKIFINYLMEKTNSEFSVLFANLDPEIDKLPNPESYLSDPNNWISCSVAAKIYERCRQILNDEMAAYKIAKYAAERVSFGYAQGIIIKGLWSSKKALKNLQKLNDKWNRNKKVELVEIRRNEAIVRLHWNRQMDITKDFCLMNQGMYTYLPLIWGGKPLHFQERCCQFEGAPYCEYYIKWPLRNRIHEVVSRFIKTKSVLTETMLEMENDKKVIEKKYEEVNRLNIELNRKIKQLQAVQDIGKAILSILDLEQLLNVIMNALSNVCRIQRAIIMLMNENEGCLENIHAIGIKEDTPSNIKKYKVSLHRVNNILVRVANTGQPEYISDIENSSLKKENIILSYGRPKSVFVMPLITRSRVIGVLGTDAVDEQGIPEETRHLIEIFSPQIAIAIENARLYEKLRTQMSDLKKSHAFLSRTEKISLLGTLAAKLAHEIKNPMTAIETFIQMLPYQFDDNDFRGNFYQLALEETRRVKGLIADLLNLVKAKESRFEKADLHALIEKMILLISPQTDMKKIEVVKQFDMEIENFQMDTEKMKQVILNILSNAVDYTPEQGNIVIRTKCFITKEKRKYIRMEIRDNGPGISPFDIEKVFDPFFTTKQKGHMNRGTGLGLFIAHQNVQDHGGALDVESKVNEGANFIVTLSIN
jgi:signal transduction histidine kinase